MANKGLIKQVEEQMEIADDLFENNIKNVKESDFIKLTSAQKRAKAHMMGVVIEQYLKSLLLWKGKTWKELKGVGHGLADLYKVLDNEGKRIFQKMLGMNQEKNYAYIDSSEEFDEIAQPKSYMSLYNGRYDGVVDYPWMNVRSAYTAQNVEELLKKIKVPDYRYSQNNLNLSDKDLVRMYQIVRCLNVLSRMARGENAKKDYQNKVNIKPKK